jgi:hypothetical protein
LGKGTSQKLKHKRDTKTRIPILLNLLLLAASAAQGQFIYTTNNGALTITGYTGSGGAVTIPSTNYGMPVAGIGTKAFSQCSSLTSVTISSGVTSIGDDAFDSSSLTSITIPNSVTSIGDQAFAQCDLISITIPCSVTNIGEWMFFYCSYLTNFTIPESVTGIGDSAFAGCESLTGITIPNSVTSIGDSAFTGCSGLTNILLGDSVTSIGDSAFNACSGLGGVTLPGGVASIGDSAFGGCSNLTAITVAPQNSVYSSLNGVLFDRSQTTLIQYPGGLGGNYTIPGTVGSIGDYAFSSDSLSGVTIPDSVASIGVGAFEACESLTNAAIGNGVTNIGGLAFQYCFRLASVTIGQSVASIGIDAFARCGLASLTLPASVANIGAEAFSFCTGLTSVYFKGDAPAAGWDVFDHDESATVYYLPNTSGWSDFSDMTAVSAVLWNPLIQGAGVNIGLGNIFGFTITGTANIPIVVQACTDLASPVWAPLQTLTLTNGAYYFGDPQYTNYRCRYYRLCSP